MSRSRPARDAHASSVRAPGRTLAGLVAAALVAASALVIATPAYAAAFTEGDFIYDSTSPSTATVTGYTGGPTATIPSTASDGTSTYTVTAIGDSAFSGKSLTGVTIPDTVTHIGNNAFGLNLLTSLVIPDSVTSMGTYAFQWNDLTTVTLGHGLTSIPAGTFFGSALTSIAIPANITAIGDEAFFNNAFTSLTIPDSVTSIGDSAFSVISTLTSLTLGKGLTSIGDYAFASTGLTTVSIPASVTDIGERAFDANGSGMASAVFQGAAPSTFSPRGPGVGSFGDVATTVYYSSAYAADFTPSPWNGYTTALGATLTFALAGHGAAIAPIVVIPGSTVPKPTDPAATDYAFQGWFTTASGAAPYDFTAPMASDATAYARWAATGLAATGAEQGPAMIVGSGVLLLGLALVITAAVTARRRRAKAE